MDHTTAVQWVIVAIKLCFLAMFLYGLVMRLLGKSRRANASTTAATSRVSVPQRDMAALRAVAGDPATAVAQLQELAGDPLLASTVAANPTAPAVVLDTLRHSWDPEVWHALVCNPNASPETLFQIAPTYPTEFFANPVVPLLLLEQPDLPLRYGEKILAPLVQHPAAPPGFLAILTHHQNTAIAAEARLHVNLVGEASEDDLERLAEEEMWRMRQDEHGWSLRNRTEDNTILPVLACGGLASWLIPPLVLHGGASVRRGVARSPGLPRKALRVFYRAGAGASLTGYGQPDPRLDARTLDRIATGDAWARGLAARHPATSPATLAHLAADNAPEVRILAARNPALPVGMLVACARDAHPAVRQAAAQNVSTPGDVLETLALKDNSALRTTVARNPSAPPQLLLRLAGDPDWRVRRQVARHPNTPVEALRRLATDPERHVRFQLARHAALPAALHEMLVADPDPIVRRLCLPAQSPRPQTAAEKQTGQTVDGKGRARQSRASRATPCDEARLHAVLQTAFSSRMLGPLEWAVVLAHPAAPAVRLSEHLKAVHWIERYAVARNPRVPMAVRERLARDTNRLVRAAARSNPAMATAGRSG